MKWGPLVKLQMIIIKYEASVKKKLNVFLKGNIKNTH